ncbi:hypothetical protein [Mannheimia pernigra]|uniref:Uncharacterized protein n=1 Tax=Mannheimia pernigra TaxID=111844 RepID=A0A7D5HPG2_9PAST|nr:hypothetical protein [Mannheimia pernigra]QLB39554.1 hypothetical protein HV559_00895 [Mannheimia pernigra]
MPDKIHYQQFDGLGRVQKTFINNDAKENTGETIKVSIDGKEVELKGIDRIETLGRNTKGQTLQVDYDNTGDGNTNSTTYLVLDQYGRAEAKYFNNDSKDTTGKTIKVTIDGKEVELKGVDSYETYKHNANGQIIRINRNLNAREASDGEAFKNDKGFEEVVYIKRDEYGREKGRYIDLDNDKGTGTGNADQGDVITLENDVRKLTGIDRYETYEYNENGQHITTSRNLDAKGELEEVEYRDVDKATGKLKGTYYNRDNDMKDGKRLDEKTGETRELEDGRTVHGIDHFTTYETNPQNRVITEKFNLDAKGEDDRVYHYDLDANGNRIGEYQNLDNDTTPKLDGGKQITGTTHTLEDGREVKGIERFYKKEYDSNNNLIKQEANLDGQKHAESVTYYVRDVLGREIARYDNANNDRLSDGSVNKTGYDHTITLDGKEVTVTGIDRIVKSERNEYGNVLKTSTNKTGEAGEEKFTEVTENKYNERRQKTDDVSTVKSEKGDWVQSSANQYTYDTYGRTNKRWFDTDSKKEGFERNETYHYNNLDQLVKVDRAAGESQEIEGYTILVKDRFDNTLKYEARNADGSLVSKVIHKYDQYGYLTQRDTYSGNDVLTIVHKYEKRDERGYIIKELSDTGVIEQRNAGDTIFEYTRDAFNTVLTRKNTRFNDDGEIASVTKEVWGYDPLGRRISTHIDTNEDGEISAGESNQKMTFYGESNLVNLTHTYVGDEYRGTFKTVHDNLNIAQVRFFAGKDREYNRFDYDGARTPRNYTDDLTTWKQEFYEEIGDKIRTINLSDTRASTVITLDNDTLAKLSSGVKPTKAKDSGKDSIILTINGDKTDTVNLKDNTEFKKLANIRGGKEEYEQYQTEVGDQTYTLLIDTDVNVVLA